MSYRRVAVVLVSLLCGLAFVQVVLAAPPENVTFTISPTVTPLVGQAITVTSTATDPDNDIVATEWDFDYDGTFEADPTDVPTDGSATHTYTTPGARQIAMRVTDGLIGDAQIDILTSPATTVTVVAPNVGPTASFSCSPTTVPQGRGTTCNASASSDPEGPVSYAWDIDGNGFNDGSDQVEQFLFNSPGTVTIRLRVTDSAGATDITQRTITVTNAAPTASFAITPNPALIGETVTFDGRSSSDTDGTIAQYAWDLDDDGQYDDGSTAVVSDSYGDAGTRTVRLRVRDNDGATDDQPRSLVVQVTRPTAALSFAPQAPLPGQAIAFTSRSTPSSSPGSPTIVNTEWDFNYDPTKDFSPDASGTTASTSYSTPGPKTVAIRVTETGGGFAVSSFTLVVNAPPQASFNVAPASPLDGDLVTFSSTSGDPDGPLTAQQWDLDGDGQYDDASGAIATKAFETGSYTVRLRVTDSRGATATAERRIDVAKRPPRLLTGVKISLFGNLTQRGVRFKRLVVRTPAKATTKITCKGRKCPKAARAASKRTSKTRRLRFKRFERAFPGGTLITVTVTRPGYIGQYTTIKIRKGQRRYVRKDRCLQPGARKPSACPDS